MNKNAAFFLTFSLALTIACQQNSSVATNQATKPAAKNSPVSSPQTLPSAIPSPAATAVVAKIYNGRGVVTQVELEKGWVEVDHEKIGDLMPAMIMQFNVEDETQLKALKVGDKVDFVLEDKAGAERLISIKKR